MDAVDSFSHNMFHLRSLWKLVSFFSTSPHRPFRTVGALCTRTSHKPYVPGRQEMAAHSKSSKATEILGLI